MHIGTTFDLERAQNWDLDWKDSLKRIVDLGMSPIRIGIKWSRVVTSTNAYNYNWSDYDHIFNYLAKNKIPTILVTGMKSPQWPEYYIPKKLLAQCTTDALNEPNAQFKKSLFSFITESINQYSHLDNITHLQVENEPFLPSGPNKWKIQDELLSSEVSLAKKLTSLPLLLTAQGLPTTGIIAEYLRGRSKYKQKLIKMGDTIGLNVFPVIRDRFIFNSNRTFKASNLAWRYFEKLANQVKTKKKEVMVTELQAEPWEGKEPDFKNPYGNKTCTPDMVREYLKRVEEIGIDTVLLWGIEFHLKCEEEGNGKWVEMLTKLVSNN